MSKIKIRLIDRKGFQQVKDNDGYCKCALVHDPDVKCMCKEFRNTHPTPDNPSVVCHCGVYEKYLKED